MANATQVAITQGVGTNIAIDDDGTGLLSQQIKVAFGPAGAVPTRVTSTTGLPVQLSSSTGAVSVVNPVPVQLGNGAAAVSATNPLPTGTMAQTAGGASNYAATGGTGSALLTAAPVSVKASAGNMYGLSFFNAGTAIAYVQFFDALTTGVTLGTTVPKWSQPVPAGGYWEEKFADIGVSFATGITIAATTTATGAVAPATGVLANILYK